jgi:hypothetical protein
LDSSNENKKDCKMKTKLYVGIALMVFFVCLVVIFGAGFTQTQNYMLNTQTQNQAVVDKNQICAIVTTDCQIGNSTTNGPATADPSTQANATAAAPGGSGNSAAGNTTAPVVTPPTTTYVPPPPTPAPVRRVVTRAS